MDFAGERHNVESRIAELKAARGRALLDGVKFDGRELGELLGRLDAISEAEIEAARRDRLVSDANLKRQHAEIIAEVRIASKVHQAALTRTQAAVNELTEALNEVIATAGSARQVWRRLNRGAPPAFFSENFVEKMLSNRLADAMQSVVNRPSFGNLRWYAFPRMAAEFSEHVTVESSLRSVLNGTYHEE
jgi:hypothetical protein